ncbi:hypothetical protein EC973_007978 [Apophysomyces ossiformis]|uniref:Zn(2)-C6 fungal-type domain-containing protein n=1 Tax=Apophysomyces ossiformis TaxID=679940 RepID=A0A8H7ETY2_9FUNG|nr:hypothetical protein EC973_007978 [Apophysomyces ossiformis]
MPENELSSKRQRVSKACEQCRRKKVKCDGTLPQCANCGLLGLTCTYKESTKKRGPPKGYIEAIEGRLHRLEALLGSIVQEDDPRSQAILAELNAPLETAYGELVRPRPMRRANFPGLEDASSLETSTDTASRPTDNLQQIHSAGVEDNANENLGNLSIDESGQLRYYGKSSGYYMLRSSKNFQNGAFHFNSRGYRNRPGSLTSIVVDPYEMPPPDLSQHLLDLYFTHFYPLFPLLHKKSFLASLQNKDKPPSPLLLNAIYAVASRISPDVRVRADPALADTSGDVFFERARILLDLEWDDFKLYTVQSLLLLSSHQNGALKNIRGWLYSGLAFRMSQNLGLNRNCDDWNLSETEKEERKRVFYCCFVLDRLTCAMHGRSPMIDERDYDTPYPTENDEDDEDRKPRIMENFHQLIKMCELLGAVLRDLYMVKGRKQLKVMSSPDSVISALDRGLNQWMAKLPPNVQYRPPNTRLNEKAPAPSLELCQLHMLFYTTLILLHRPFIPGPTQTVPPSVFPSASICTFAANKILDIVESLMAEGRLKNVNNYALYFMFTAGIIFINDAASPDSMFAFEAKISINKIIRAMDAIEATWITSARHCNILGELAGLRDINLECVEEGYSRKTQTEEPAHMSLSIAVPNSPEAAPENPRPTGQRYPDYFAKQGSSIQIRDQPISAPESQYSSAAPTLINAFSVAEPKMDVSRPFDPAGTAFWGVPSSFDIDEWNSYFSNQNHQTQSLLTSSVPQTRPQPTVIVEPAVTIQGYPVGRPTVLDNGAPQQLW